MKSQVEEQIIKMVNVTREIRTVLDALRKNQDFDGVIDQQILSQFIQELEIILEYSRELAISKDSELAKSQPVHSEHEIQKKMTDIITETQQEYQKSQTSPSKIQSSKQKIQIRLSEGGNDFEIQIAELVDLNHQLSQENDFLSKKLQEFEDYIKKLELQLAKEKEQPKSLSDLYATKNQNERLKTTVREMEEFIFKNNQDFVRQIQKYNQKLWKLEKEVDTLKRQLFSEKSYIEQQNLLLNKLREQNFNLELNNRQYKMPRQTNQINENRKIDQHNQRYKSNQAINRNTRGVFYHQGGMLS